MDKAIKSFVKMLIWLLVVLLIVIGATALFGYQRYYREFCASDIATVAANSTVTNGTDFTSREIDISTYPDRGALQVWFTRASTSENTVEFYFQVSIDGGSTWDSSYYVLIRLRLNTDAVGTVVRATRPVYFYGVSKVRLYKVMNNDTSIAVTNVNARVGM